MNPISMLRSLLLCLALVRAMSAIADAQPAVLSIPHLQASPGETVEVAVSFRNLEEVFAFRVVVDVPNTSPDYPLEYISRSSKVRGTSTQGWTSLENDATTRTEPPPGFPGAVLINGFGVSALNGDGILVRFRLRVKETAAYQVVPLTFRMDGSRPTALNDGAIPLMVEAGSITITEEDAPTITPRNTPTPVQTITPGPTEPPVRTPTPSATPRPQPTRTPSPGITPTATLPPAGDLEVRITDNADSREDLTGQVDYDDADSPILALRWDWSELGVRVSEVRRTQVLVQVNQTGDFVELGRTASGAQEVFEWRRNAPRVERPFRDGPELDTRYAFQLVIHLRSGEVLGPYTTDGTVDLQPAIRITDSEDTTLDLAGGEDRDPVTDRALVIRWAFNESDVPLQDVEDYQIYVRETEGRFLLLGSGGNPFANRLVWQEDNPLLSARFRNGPVFGQEYDFRVYAVTRSGNPRFYGPFEPQGTVRYLEGEDSPPTPRPSVTPDSSPTPGLTATPSPTPIAVVALTVGDNLNSTADLSGQVDFDGVNQAGLTIRWAEADYVLASLEQLRLEVSVNGGPYQTLVQAGSVNVRQYTWRADSPVVEAAFQSGPRPGHTYAFRLLAFGRDGTLQGSYVNPAAVRVESAVTITDDETQGQDLSGGFDADPDDNRELVVRWQWNEEEFAFGQPDDFHVYVAVNEDRARYLGRTRSGAADRLVWNEEARVAGRFRDGPIPGNEYAFQVYAIGGGRQALVEGPFETQGAVWFLDSDDPMPTATATLIPTPTATPTPVATVRPNPTRSPTPTASPSPTNTPVATPTPEPEGIVISGIIQTVIGSEPIAGATIEVGEWETSSGMDGGFRLVIPRPGRYEVRIRAVGYRDFESTVRIREDASYTVRLLPDPQAPTPTPVDEAFTVFGIVFDAWTFTPLANAEVTINGVSLLTNANGYFSLEGIRRGVYTITVRYNGNTLMQSPVLITDTTELLIPVWAPR